MTLEGFHSELSYCHFHSHFIGCLFMFVRFVITIWHLCEEKRKNPLPDYNKPENIYGEALPVTWQREEMSFLLEESKYLEQYFNLPQAFSKFTFSFICVNIIFRFPHFFPLQELCFSNYNLKMATCKV